MLILLDIDGVMIKAPSWKPAELLNDGFTRFSSKSTFALQKIISETNASIVLTTSHKNTYTLTQWKKIFKDRGIDIVSIDRLDNNDSYLSRKEEILNWLNKNKSIQNYVILDDDKSLNGLPFDIKKKLVQTDSMVGLSEEHIKSAIDILMSSELIKV